ncbi:C3a anaphylatoxin chemotactic receptor-like [Leptodactylus fuscus]|uniref:C3a anaphylatoxin chemotactic receptor-like n=1 Tax=Leptodactylus fuscus TaxID=238119 RepID=UPI003F4E8CAA
MSHTLYGIIFVLGIIGNGLVIWIAGFRMKRTVNTLWFLHLAIADFLCCASITLRIAQWTFISYGKPDEFFIFCLLTIVLFAINMTASVLLLTAMSIDRCVSVMWPFWAKVHRTCRLVRITAGGIWVFSLLITGLVSLLYGLYLYDFNEWCVIDVFAGNMIKQIVQLIRLVIMFVIPFLIILTSYVFIFLKLRKSKRPRRSQRPYRIITAVILCFFICWSPYYIWPLTPMYDGDNLQFYIVNTIVTNLAYLNSCLNPIIYVFMSQDVKLGFLRSIFARVERALSEHAEPEDGEHSHTTDV